MLGSVGAGVQQGPACFHRIPVHTRVLLWRTSMHIHYSRGINPWVPRRLIPLVDGNLEGPALVEASAPLDAEEVR